MNSDIKPDFEKIIGEAWESANKFHDRSGGVNPMPFRLGGRFVWTNHVEPLLSTVKRLQEENEKLKACLKWALNNLNNYDKPSEADLLAYNKASELLKSSELNKES